MKKLLFLFFIIFSNSAFSGQWGTTYFSNNTCGTAGQYRRIIVIYAPNDTKCQIWEGDSDPCDQYDQAWANAPDFSCKNICPEGQIYGKADANSSLSCMSSCPDGGELNSETHVCGAPPPLNCPPGQQPFIGENGQQSCLDVSDCELNGESNPVILISPQTCDEKQHFCPSHSYWYLDHCECAYGFNCNQSSSSSTSSSSTSTSSTSSGGQNGSSTSSSSSGGNNSSSGGQNSSGGGQDSSSGGGNNGGGSSGGGQNSGSSGSLDLSGVESRLDHANDNLDDIAESLNFDGAEFDTNISSELTPFYESEYPNGLAGIWNDKKSELMDTGPFTFLHQFSFSYSDDSIPDWQLCLDFGFANLGCHSLTVPSFIWAFIKICILITAAWLCRALVFGG